MRTDAIAGLAALLVLCAATTAEGAPADPAGAADTPGPELRTEAGWTAGGRTRWSVQIPGEVNLVGLVGGVRPALLFRPAGPRGSFTVRGSLGVLAGAEYLYVPIGVGVRSVIVPKKKVHPYFGAGFELQTFWVDDAPPVARPAVMVEAGLLVDIGERAGIFFEVAPDLAFVRPGFGLSLRLGVQLNPPPRGPTPTAP